MADGMMIPPWIQPADTARNYLSGLQIGVNIAQQTQRLQAQREAAAMESEVRLRQLEQQSAERRQRIEMDRAYREQMTGLRQQELEQAAQKNALATRLAATKFAAQQEYRKRVSGGEDPSKVMLELGPALGASAGDYGAALKQRSEKAAGPVQAYPVMFQDKPVPGLIGVPTSGGGMTTRAIPQFRPEGLSPADRQSAAAVLRAERAELLKEIPAEPKTAEYHKKWEEKTGKIRQQVADIDRRLRMLLPGLSVGTTNAPTAAAMTPTGEPIKDVRWDPKKKKYVVAEPVPPSEWRGHEGDEGYE